MNKGIKYSIWVVVIAFIGYNSVYFKKLSEVKAAGEKFNAVAYAQRLYSLLTTSSEKAITLDQLINELQADKAKAFNQYGKALAIGSTRFFMVSGSGIVKAITENEVVLSTDNKNELHIATEFVFGNAIRDASGQVNLNDFTNTADLNNISSEVNKIVRNKVLPPFKSAIKTGDRVAFTGAVGLNREHLDLNGIELMPINLNIVK
jgi:predicted lipoprotein